MFFKFYKLFSADKFSDLPVFFFLQSLLQPVEIFRIFYCLHVIHRTIIFPIRFFPFRINNQTLLFKRDKPFDVSNSSARCRLLSSSSQISVNFLYRLFSDILISSPRLDYLSFLPDKIVKPNRKLSGNPYRF